ncbi:alpha-protein kinase 3 isoform X2 [Thunnus thynnus]|uniref:alpha-protein kinase 3 isoform X2 n=1 Tax=Thunnus thynnus TaxID=8237 RepID=UPI003527C03A
MTSRRPMTRSFSGNGRTSSFSEEESNGRSESRNSYLSNVRPENRSTLCSVMAQLTEDIQPSFDTTLKSKAVSENCNVKFTCVVSGYPAPELKWYKDDMEMDRYCGLPKYEIRRNGKTHTLHIYNCTLDDAAIYQVSASNSKGIVSCSGVLEVGTMNEYKIHQRFFAKLKQKAEKKKKDMEDHTKKVDKENIQREKPRVSPERPPRKRPVPQPQQIPAVKEPEAVEQLGAAAEPNGVSSEVKETAPVTSIESGLEKEIPPSEETLAKKKIKITNGVDTGGNSSSNSSSRSHMMGNGGENCYDGGISLAQFLAETLQSQTNDEKQNSPLVEKPREMDKPIVNTSKEQEKKQKEREEQEKTPEEELEREKKREQELAIKREKEQERLSEMLHMVDHPKHGSEVKHHSKAHKDHDQHNIQTSISSMLHTVKDFFFGKGKKDSHDHIENKGREFDHLSPSTQPYPSQPDTPPSFRLQMEHHPEVDKSLTEEVVPMETDKPKGHSETVDIEQQSVSPELLMPDTHKHEDSVLHTDLAPANSLPPESVEESTGQSVKEADDAVEAMKVSVGAESSGPHEEMSLSGLQVLTEGKEKDSQLPLDHQDPDCVVVSPQPTQQSARDESSPREDISVFPQTQVPIEEEYPPTSTLASLKDNQASTYSVISVTDSHNHGETPTEAVQEEEISVDSTGKEAEANTEEGCSTKLCEEEKTEVKSNTQPSSDINSSEITELPTPSLEVRIETRESKTSDQVLSPLSTMEAHTSEGGNFKEEVECASVIQEMNVGFPPTAAPESLEMGDLKIQQISTASVAEESKELHNHSAEQSLNSGITNSEEKSDLKEVLFSDLEKDLEVNSCNNLKVQEQEILECKRTEARNESSKFEMETDKETQVKVEENQVKVEETQVKVEDTQMKYEENQVKLEETQVKVEEDQVKLEENQVKVEENQVKAEENQVKVEETHVKLEENQVKVEENQVKVEENQVKVEGNQVKLEENQVKVEENQVKVEVIQVKVEENQVKVEELDESKTISVTQNKEGNANVLEEPCNVARQDGNEKQLDWASDNVPQIQISSCTEDIKPAVPDLSPNEHFIIPKIEIMEPELKECTLPLSILALNKTETEPALLQNHDAIIQEQSVSDSSDLMPTQKGMQNDYNPSTTKKVKEVVQFHDETEKPEWEQTQIKSSEQLPQLDYAKIPVINVSCSEDKENGAFVNTHVSDTPKPVETPKAPSFVVPPISVTCHESDLIVASQCESTETETSATMQRGTKHDVDNNAATKPEKTQNQEEMAEKNVTGNTPSVLFEAPVPKVGDSVPSLSKTTQDNFVPEILKTKTLKEAKIENSVTVEDLLRNRSSVERLTFKPPAHPSLSPASLRKFMSKAAPDSDNEAVTSVPVITVGDRQNDKADEDLSGGSTPTSSLSCESSPRLKRKDSLSLIRSATPEELASGARRKIFIPKTKEDGEGAVGALDTQSKKETPYMSPSQARRAALLQAPMGQNTPPMERRSPLLSRRKTTLEVPKVVEETPSEEPVSTKREEKPAEKKLDPLKAPQVIRKIRGEPFPDASGHLKLWCQFFNVLSDSTIKWYRDEEEILEVKRSGGDESQVALAIVLASSPDCGVYGCTIKNEYGTDTTDYLLSVDILSEILLKDDLEVGEEIEMTPLLFSKGIADCGNWGNKYFGRIMTETVHIGEGAAHKASRVKVIYGLDPVFESGSTCIIKVQNPIAYGTKQESNLTERNLEITRQECKIQNMIREYCKIFAAEARVAENFGHSLEVNPQYLMYRPANSVPYATVEADLKGVFLKYCMMDPKGRLITRTISEVEQKCCTFQHWIHQWTHGNLLVTRMEGVEMKITNVKVVTKSKGYQGLTDCGSPEVFEQFLTQHKCNYYCGLLGLRPLKTMDSLQQPTKMKGSRSPLLNRKLGAGSGSPQLQRKGHSPQLSRKATSSPKVTRKVQETEDNKSGAKPKPAETLDVLETR